MVRTLSSVTPPEASSFTGRAQAAIERHGLAQSRGREIIEHRDIGADGDRFAQLLDIFDLDLDARIRVQGARVGDRGRDRAGGHDVIFLDEHAVIEADPMILAAADSDRVFLRGAQSRNRLASIEHAATRAFDQRRIAVRGGCGRRQQLQKIERGAFGGQQRPRAARNVEEPLARMRDRAFLDLPVDLHLRVEALERGVDIGPAADDRRLARDDRGAAIAAAAGISAAVRSPPPISSASARSTCAPRSAGAASSAGTGSLIDRARCTGQRSGEHRPQAEAEARQSLRYTDSYAACLPNEAAGRSMAVASQVPMVGSGRADRRIVQRDDWKNR